MVPSNQTARNRTVDRRRALVTGATAIGLVAGALAWVGPERPNALDDGADREGTRADPEEVFVHGWYPSWAQYDDRYLPEEVSFGRHDSLSAFSVHPDEDGRVVYSDEPNDPDMLSAFERLKRDDGPASGTPIHLTIGGWENSAYFSNAAVNGTRRDRFASSAVATMRRYDLDGIDIDWEYPTGDSPAGSVEREEDVDNVVSLLETLRGRLDAAGDEDGREYTLTYAAPHQREHLRALHIEEMDRYVDYWIVMAFEMAGGWATETRHDSPNYPSDAYEAPDSTARAMSDWIEMGNVRRDSLVVETGFYGKVFDGVPPGPRGDGLGQPFERYVGSIGRPETARLERSPGWERYWDDDAEAAYMYNRREKRWVTYATPRTMARKVDYLLEEGFAGITGWETSFDPDDELLGAILDAMARSRKS